MYNGFEQVGPQNQRQPQERSSGTHELDGVKFKLADHLNSLNNQSLSRSVQSVQLGSLQQYNYDFRLEEKVLQKVLANNIVINLKDGITADKMSSTCARKGSNIEDLCYLLVNTNLASVERLLSQGQRPDVAGPDGRTPLLKSVTSGDMGRVSLLHRYGAGLNQRDRQERNSLHIAALYKQEAMIHKLCSLGVEKDAVDSDGMTPLMISLAVQAPDLTKLLILQGCDVNAGGVHIDELSALHLAIMRREYHESVVPALLRAGADVNKPDSVGRTPLIYAIKQKALDLVKLLLEHRADPDKSHAFLHAYDLDFTEGAVLLLSYGADPTSMPSLYGTVFKLNALSSALSACLSLGDDEYTRRPILKCVVTIEAAIAQDGTITSLAKYPSNRILYGVYRVDHSKPEHSRMFYKLLAYGFDVGRLWGKCFCNMDTCGRKVSEIASRLGIPVPLPLKVLSRNQVRLCLGRGVSQKAKQLAIPAVLQQFLSEKVWDDSDWSAM